MEHIITFIITMLTVTNPLGALAIFAGLTADRSATEKKAIAFKTAVAVGIILLSVTWLGTYLLKALGVTTAGLEVAGGVIIALMGLSMLHSKTSHMAQTKEEHQEAESKEAIAIVPMAMPIIAGPGAITTIVLATEKFPTFGHHLIISATTVAVALVIWLSLYFAAPISQRLGVTGMNVVTKIMGIVLTAIAFQMLATGLKQLLPGLA